MSLALRKPMTLEAFLDWESRQPVKYEFDGFDPVAMTGVTLEHAAIQRNLLRHLGNHLDGKPCQPYGSDLKIQVAGSIRYPDAFVVCSPLPRGTTVVSDPVVVFEILSPSTAETDLTEKNREYRDTASVQRYVILEQSHQAAIVFERRAGDWIGHLLAGDAVLTMPEIGVELPLASLYQGVELPALPAAEPA